MEGQSAASRLTLISLPANCRRLLTAVITPPQPAIASSRDVMYDDVSVHCLRYRFNPSSSSQGSIIHLVNQYDVDKAGMLINLNLVMYFTLGNEQIEWTYSETQTQDF